MGLFGAMTSSVAGLNVQGQAISVISDNLANTNTVGYKTSRSLFSQMVTSSGVSGTAYNAGGVAVTTQRDQTTQGSLTSTTSKTDLAISGNGYFRVADSATINSNTSYYYTRAGSFTENKQGYLVTSDGYYLQGWQTDSTGKIVNMQNLENIELQSVGVSSQPTSEVEIGANLDSTADVMNYSTDSLGNAYANFGEALDGILESSDSNVFRSDMRIYDAQGGARDVTVVYSKRAANLWDYQIITDGANIQGGTEGVETRISSGTLEFSTTGLLKNVTTTNPTTGAVVAQGSTTTINWSNGVDPSTVEFNFGSFTGGLVATPTSGMSFSDGVVGLSLENAASPTGAYTLSEIAGVLTLTGPDGSTATATMPTVSAGNVGELIFENANFKVRMTVDSSFTVPVSPATTTFDAVAAQKLGQGGGMDGVQQKSSSFNTSFTNQDGYGAGLLSSISIDEDGYVSGTFTNGETKKLYKVALAVFQNQNGLEAVSGSLLRPTDDSGDALIKEPGVGGTGRIESGALEGSTTDIATEFSQMIVAQRAFQANSSVIDTVDQMLNNLLQLR